MEKLFVFINRLNNLLFLLVLICAILAISWISFKDIWNDRDRFVIKAESSNESRPIYFSFDRVETVTGTDTQILCLVADDGNSKFASGSAYYDHEIRNVLFLSGSNKKPTWLFKKPNYLLLVVDQLGPEREKGKLEPTRALYFEFVDADTNKDGKLTNHDETSIALTKPDGSGFVNILHGVNRVLSHEQIDLQYVSIIYQIGNKIMHSRFALNSFEKISEQVVTDVPQKF